jgi:membrane-associated phospholipid phosphatase
LEGRRATRSLALVCLSTALATGAVYLFTVGTPLGQLVGELILGGRALGLERVLNAEDVLATFSRAALLIGAVAVVAIALLQGRPRLAVTALLAIIGANLTTQLLKFVLLSRTDLLDGLFYPLPNSFPSGHATAVASVAVGLLLVAPALLRAPLLIVSAVIVALVGVSTLVTGWHRMADAIGGTFVATSWGAGAGAILTWRRGVEAVGPRTAEFAGWGARIPVVLGVCWSCLEPWPTWSWRSTRSMCSGPSPSEAAARPSSPSASSSPPARCGCRSGPWAWHCARFASIRGRSTAP